MNNKHRFFRRARPFFIIGLLALLVACFSVADEVPQPEPTQAPPLRELRIFIEPRDCTSYILDPQPTEGSK